MGHDLPGFVRATVAANLRWLLHDKEDLLTPITRLFLFASQEEIDIVGIDVASGDARHEILHADVPATTLPVGNGADRPLDELIVRYGLKRADVGWIPLSWYWMEMIHAARQVAAQAAAAGLQFAPRATIGLMIEDTDYTDPEEFRLPARRALATLQAQTARALVALYYPDPDTTGLLDPPDPLPADIAQPPFEPADIYVDQVPPDGLATLARLRRLLATSWTLAELRELLTAQPIFIYHGDNPAAWRSKLEQFPDLRPFLFYGERGRLKPIWPTTPTDEPLHPRRTPPEDQHPKRP